MIIKPETKPQKGAPILNKLKPDNVTRNVIKAPIDLSFLKDSTNDCFNTVNSAKPPRVIMNSFGNLLRISRTVGEYNPNNIHNSEKMIAEIAWFFTLGSFIIIPVTGPVKHVDTAPK